MTRGIAPDLALRRTPDADSRTSSVKDALDELDHRIHPSLGASPHFKSCWEQVTLVRSLLSNLRHSRKEDRNTLCSRLNELCDSLKHLQDEYFLGRKVTSERIRGYVLNDLQSAHFSAEGARDADTLREPHEKMQEIRERLLSHEPDSWGVQMLKEDRDHCWEAYAVAREALHSRRVAMQDLEYSQLRGPVATVEADAGRGNPFEVFSRIKELQRDVRAANLSKDQLADLKSTLRSAWEKASLRAAEHKQSKRNQMGSTETMFEEIIERKRQGAAPHFLDTVDHQIV